jgi:delta24-sterol reductase
MTETHLPPRERLEELKHLNPEPDPDSVLYCAKLQKEHLGNHDHAAAVSTISNRIRHFHSYKQPFRIYHGSTNSTRRRRLDRSRMVDTSGLTHILSVDKVAKTALVEPNVPMDALVAFLQPYGLVPPVVMEFPGITVGGGVAGTSGESSSFRYGFFDKTVQSIEIVLGNGDVVTASEDENQDLFLGAAGSFGTLGVTTCLELRLVESAFWVELKYWPVTSMEEALEVIAEKSIDEKIDYLDGILYSASSGVIVTGRRHSSRDLQGAQVVRFTRDYDPWFYLHAQDAIKGHSGSQLAASPAAKGLEPVTEATPLRDYLFRYDRGAFWTGRYAFAYFLVPFTAVTRWALDYFMHTRIMYHALHESGQGDSYIIQDLAIPFSKAQEFVEYVDNEFGLYPLWLCPLKPIDDGSARKSFHPLGKGKGRGEMLVNVGVWGPGPRNRRDFVTKNRELEAKVRELGGMKWLYAHAYYTEDEFWDIYDREWYDKLRAKYHAESLPTVYEKVRTEVEDRRSMRRKIMMAIWPLSGLYGIYKALFGGSYMVERGPRRLSFGGLLVVLAGLMGVSGVLLAMFSTEREVLGL